MRVMRPNRELLEDMLQWEPDVVILCLGGNNITTRCQPRKINLRIIELCRLVRTRGVATMVLADICKRWVFRDPALTSDRFSKFGSSIAHYKMMYFPVASMVHMQEEKKHWCHDGVHLSEAGVEEFMTSLRLKLRKILTPTDL
ncbi:hypothetical protein DPMN_045196 [Dreissena polymorpha]|uniref:SGNH hydrolase-type esterase domain-containing protein n=1 Tax=Dreissena polymorpha TaxID=45954 RepID=A0A9D4D7B2_DREPO|nr:hypothetical protein DPMN_045196 [Dreissena polymorpha]